MVPTIAPGDHGILQTQSRASRDQQPAARNPSTGEPSCREASPGGVQALGDLALTPVPLGPARRSRMPASTNIKPSLEEPRSRPREV